MPTVHVFNESRIAVISVAGVVIRPLRTVVTPGQRPIRGHHRCLLCKQGLCLGAESYSRLRGVVQYNMCPIIIDSV